MGSSAATGLRTALGQIEAASKLMSNREKVVQDITNAGPKGVNGGQLSQTHLKRLDRQHQASVDAMMKEVCSRLLGTTTCDPSTEQVQVWGAAAKFFAARIQASKGECPERGADMSSGAATAMRTVLAEITSKSAAMNRMGGMLAGMVDVSACEDSGDLAIVSASAQTEVEATSKRTATAPLLPTSPWWPDATRSAATPLTLF